MSMAMSKEQFDELVSHIRGDNSQDAVEVGSVAVKLPSFWTQAPDMWFFQIEAVFNNRQPKVTVDATKFNHAVAALPQDVLLEIRHIIGLPETTPDRYVKLKEALTETYGKDGEEKQAELLQFIARSNGLGNRKPINLLMHIRHLSGSSYEALERAIFLNQLPAPVRTALANSTAANNATLAREAGKILRGHKLAESSTAAPHVSEVAVEEVPAQLPTAVSAVMPSSSFATAARGREPRAAQAPMHRPFVCFPHAKYGPKAFTCKSSRCAMRNQVSPRPAQGNGNAGR